MFVALRLLHLSDTDRESRTKMITTLRAATAGLAGMRGCWITAVSDRAVINAGGIVWRMTFVTEADALAAVGTAQWQRKVLPIVAAARVTDLGYRMGPTTVRRTGAGIWRALIFRVMPHTPSKWVRALEQSLPLLPDHVSEIRSWALSRIAYAEGPKAYTHVWEQEFDSIDGLTGPYMTDPAHWGIADAFFDAEDPRYCVDPQLVQVVGGITHTILEPSPSTLRGA